MAPKELLQDWLIRISIAQAAHYEMESHCRMLHYVLGIPVVIVTATVGAIVVAGAKDAPSAGTTWVAGGLSVLAAILSGLQTFLGYADQAARHRTAAVKYSTLRREIEQQLAFDFPDAGTLRSFLDSVRNRWDALNTESPNTLSRTFNRISARYEGKRHLHGSNSG